MVAVDFTQDGNMSVAWGPVDHQRTISFLNLIGPPDQRVLVSTNINPDASQQQIEQEVQARLLSKCTGHSSPPSLCVRIIC